MNIKRLAAKNIKNLAAILVLFTLSGTLCGQETLSKQEVFSGQEAFSGQEILSKQEVFSGQEALINAFKLSYALEKNKEYSKAIDKLKAVYTPVSYELNLRLGWLNYLSGKLDESCNYYSKSITLNPYAIEPRFGMIKPLTAQGKWNDVLALYNKIVEIDPQNSTANYQIGLIYYTRQNYEKADLYLEKVINLYPFDYDTMLLLAWNKLYLQKTKEAKVLFGKVLLYNPDDKSALEGLK